MDLTEFIVLCSTTIGELKFRIKCLRFKVKKVHASDIWENISDLVYTVTHFIIFNFFLNVLNHLFFYLKFSDFGSKWNLKLHPPPQWNKLKIGPPAVYTIFTNCFSRSLVELWNLSCFTVKWNFFGILSIFWQAQIIILQMLFTSDCSRIVSCTRVLHYKTWIIEHTKYKCLWSHLQVYIWLHE